jgi:hypothetical protein
MSTTATAPDFATLVREFFCQRLITQQNASARTVASYRDMFRLLLRYFADHRGRPPTALTLADLDAPAVLAFLDHLERGRDNSIATRNVRLAALRSFLKYASARARPVCPPFSASWLSRPSGSSVASWDTYPGKRWRRSWRLRPNRPGAAKGTGLCRAQHKASRATVSKLSITIPLSQRRLALYTPSGISPIQA